MAEVELRAIHAVTVEMHGGMLTLAIACVLLKMADLTWQRFLPRRLLRLHGFVAKASGLAGPASILAALGGIAGLVASAITGYLMVPGATLTDDPLAMNKVMVTTFAIELWSIYLLLAVRHFKTLWDPRSPLALVASASAILGFASSVIGGSLGGTMAGKGSVLAPVWELLNVDIHRPWILATQTAILLAIAVNVLAFLFLARRARRGQATPRQSQSAAEEPAP